MSGEIDLMGVGGQLLGGLSLFLYGMEKMSHSANMHRPCIETTLLCTWAGRRIDATR
jgi:hypothetical protein